MDMEVSGQLEHSSAQSGVTDRVEFKPDDFTQNIAIGKGKDSVIYRALCSSLGGQEVAVKVYLKSRLSSSKFRAVKREAAMMMYMNTKRVPRIPQFFGAFQDSRHIYIVMEYCSGGDLLELLLKEGKAMSERRVCQEVAVPILTTLAAMHALSIIHRDIKLENIFLQPDGTVELGDFGLTMCTKQELAISPVGTVEYMAPEIIALPAVDGIGSTKVKSCDITPCTEKVDIWALGVTLYELLTGHLPFDGKDKTNIKKAIAEGRIKSLPSSHSGECIEFVASMLRQNPAQRPSCQELLQHPYVLKHCQQAGPSTPRISDSSPSRMVIDAGSSRGSSTTASGAAAALPGSFSVRHNQEAAGASSAGATRSVDMSPVAFQADSQDGPQDLIRARHAQHSGASMASLSSSAGSAQDMSMAGSQSGSQSGSRSGSCSPLGRPSSAASSKTPAKSRLSMADYSSAAPSDMETSRQSSSIFQKMGSLFKTSFARSESASPSSL